jgi:hypothetical protein
MYRQLLAILAMTLLSGCASRQIDIGVETAAISASAKIASSELAVVTRCQFVRVPSSASMGDWANAVCAMSQSGDFHARLIDYSSGLTREGPKLELKDVLNVSLYESLVIAQLQIRTQSGEVFALVSRPDGGIGVNNDGSRKMLELLKQQKVVEVPSRAIIGNRLVQSTVVVPVYVPVRKK